MDAGTHILRPTYTGTVVKSFNPKRFYEQLLEIFEKHAEGLSQEGKDAAWKAFNEAVNAITSAEEIDRFEQSIVEP